VIIDNNINEGHWSEFIQKCEYATIYHTPQWKKILEQSFGYKPYYQFVKDESGRIIGMLPLFYLKSKITGNRLCCLPFSHDCGYIGDSDAFYNLIVHEIINLHESLGCDMIEIRAPTNETFSENLNFSTFILNLSSYKPERNVRWGIKKAEKSGNHVETSKDVSTVKEFYELNCITKREKGVPAHSLEFFKNIFLYLSDFTILYIVKNNHESISGGLMLYYKNTVLYGYGAANPMHLDKYPYYAFLWKAITDATHNGFKYFDFGRVHRENQGLASFKRRWGSVEKTLTYSSYPSTSIDNKRTGFVFRTEKELIKKMPLPIYKGFSDRFFKHFG
jgi:hypothetical protein